MAIKMPTATNLSCPTDNYIICHHTGKTFVIPVDPDNIADSMSASFATNTPLSRSAPIYSYQNSGPRTVAVQFLLHRDLFQEFNPGEQDATETLITNLHSLVLPDYDSASKMVNPPRVSLKLRDEIYIKGVIVGGVSVGFQLPILNYGTDESPLYKYAQVNIGFTVSETTPYSASILPSVGGMFRG